MRYTIQGDVTAWLIRLGRLVGIYIAIDVACSLHAKRYVFKLGKNAASIAAPSSGSDADDLPPTMTMLYVQVTVGAVIACILVLLVAEVLSQLELVMFSSAAAITESAIFVVFVAAHSYALSKLMETKKYFDYRSGGLQALPAYRDILTRMLICFSLSPVVIV